MTRYTGKTLLTYEEWWAWERTRLQAGKLPSQRFTTLQCSRCMNEGHPAMLVHKMSCDHVWSDEVSRVHISIPRKTKEVPS